MNTANAPRMARWFTLVGSTLLLVIFLAQAALAGGAASMAMAGAEVARKPDGIPLNPAAVVAVPETNAQLGVNLPRNGGFSGYAVFYEPRDPRGFGASLSGVLGVTYDRRLVGYDALTKDAVYKTDTTVLYQLAEDYRSFGSVGVGLRFTLNQEDSPKRQGTAWRVDLGWQKALSSAISVGLVARDVLGTDTSWSNGDRTLRQLDLRAGTALQLGSKAVLALDAGNIGAHGPQEWAAGITVSPTDAIALRGGYRLSSGVRTFTLGGGLRFGTWRIDVGSTVAKSPTGTLGATIEF